jgi:hypothetical protein
LTSFLARRQISSFKTAAMLGMGGSSCVIETVTWLYCIGKQCAVAQAAGDSRERSSAWAAFERQPDRSSS